MSKSACLALIGANQFMATGKKSVILYCDLIHTIEELDDVDAGLLFKHYLRYINDQNPEPPNKLIKIAFEPIKQSLKRDLVSWEEKKITKSESGILGNLKRWHTDLYDKVIKGELDINNASHIAKGRTPSQKVANIAVSVSDSVSVNVKNNIEERKLKFASTLDSFKEVYPNQMLDDFFKYWTEPNKSGTKFRQELEKTWDLSRRLETWSRNDKNYKVEKVNKSNLTFKELK